MSLVVKFSLQKPLIVGEIVRVTSTERISYVMEDGVVLFDKAVAAEVRLPTKRAMLAFLKKVNMSKDHVRNRVVKDQPLLIDTDELSHILKILPYIV